MLASPAPPTVLTVVATTALLLAPAPAAVAQTWADAGANSWERVTESIETVLDASRETGRLGEDVRAMARAVAADDLPAARAVAERLLRPPAGGITIMVGDTFWYERALGRRLAAVAALAPADGARLLHCGDEQVTTATLDALATMGEAGAPHRDAVRRLLKSKPASIEVQRRAVGCLLAITPEGEAALDQHSVGGFLTMYWGNGDEAAAAEPTGQPDEQRYMGAGLVAEGLFRALHSTGHTRSEVPALLHAAEHGTRDERVFALVLLSRLNREAAPAADALSALLNRQQDPFLRELTAWALVTTRGEPAAIEAVADRLRFADAAEREEFVSGGREFLDAIAKEERDTVEFLLEQPGAPALLNAGRSRHSDLRFYLRGLKSVEIDLPPAAARAVEALTTHPDEDIRRLAAEVLGATAANP